MRLIGLNPCSHPPLLIHWRLRCLQKEKDIMGCTLVERVRKFLSGELSLPAVAFKNIIVLL
jgi:hypothetical protein